MLPLSDAVNVRPVGPIEALTPTSTVGDVRQDAFARSVQLLIGQQLQGEILSRLKDGSFLVNVAGIATRMALPDGAQAGTSIPMTLISVQPRPTFLLGSELNATTSTISADARIAEELAGKNVLTETEGEAEIAHNANSNPASSKSPASAGGQLIDRYVQTAGMLRGQQADIGKSIPLGAGLAANAYDRFTSTPTSLSVTGQLINHLLQAAQEQNSPTTLLGKTPLVATPNTPSDHVATVLHDTLAFSGLFYESHVGDWADGKRSMAELMREPQMQAAANPNHSADPTIISQPDGNDLTQLINLQLNSLEQQSAQWRGELWPGQGMEWDVKKEESQGSEQAGGDDTASWRSAVRFNFPHLGALSATIHLKGEHVQIQLNAGTEDAASALRTHVDALSGALAAAGSTLDSMIIKQDDKP